MRLFVTDESKGSSDKKCGGCNWATSTFYGLGKTKKDARADFTANDPKEYGRGLCSQCMVELIVDETYDVKVGR